MRDGVPQLLEERRVHRTSVRVHRGAEGSATAGRRDGTNASRFMDLWARRWATKSNSVAYIVQRAAEAVYSDAGRDAGAAPSSICTSGNAARLREGCVAAGHDGLRRRQRAVRLGRVPRWPVLVGYVRSPARADAGRDHTGGRLRILRRRATSESPRSTHAQNIDEVVQRIGSQFGP